MLQIALLLLSPVFAQLSDIDDLPAAEAQAKALTQEHRWRLARPEPPIMAPQPVFRKDLIRDFSDADREILFEAMWPYIQQHSQDHNGAAHTGADFYFTHIRMIHGLENELKKNGLGRFVPLPGWEPSNPPPGRFGSWISRKNRPDSAHLVGSERFFLPEICKFDGLEAFSASLFKWHQPMHDWLGFGDPIFWNYHAWVLDAYQRWNSCPGKKLPAEPEAEASHTHH